jgi:hypothetical protein
MTTISRTVFLWASLLALLAFTEAESNDACVNPGTVQCAWIAPSLPDNSTNITLGETYVLQWDETLQDDVTQYLPGADPNNLALWMTPSDSGSGQTLVSRWLPSFPASSSVPNWQR